jgi:hypothetical protein
LAAGFEPSAYKEWFKTDAKNAAFSLILILVLSRLHISNGSKPMPKTQLFR